MASIVRDPGGYEAVRVVALCVWGHTGKMLARANRKRYTGVASDSGNLHGAGSGRKSGRPGGA